MAQSQHFWRDRCHFMADITKLCAILIPKAVYNEKNNTLFSNYHSKFHLCRT